MMDWDASRTAEAMGDVTICFTPESQEFDFDLKVNPSMADAAQAAGVELLVFNIAYSSFTQPLENADACVTREPDLAVSFKVFAELTEAIMSKYNAENIPVIAVDVTHPGSVFWGADNYATGRYAAEFAAAWAEDHMWPEEETIVLTGPNPAVGGAPACRNTAFTDFFKENYPAIPQGNYFDVDMRTAELGANAGALAATTDWLTANPDAKYAFATSINDDRAFGIASVMSQADRGDPTVNCGANGIAASQCPVANTRRWFAALRHSPGSAGWMSGRRMSPGPAASHRCRRSPRSPLMPESR